MSNTFPVSPTVWHGWHPGCVLTGGGVQLRRDGSPTSIDRKHQAMSEQVWLPLIRSSSQQTLGQTILRLASLAQAAHQQQTADGYHGGDACDVRADGPAPQDVVAADIGGLDHTEVDR